MDFPGYVLLLLATAAGLAAAFGGVMWTLPTPHLQAAQAAFWVVAICFAGLGIVWAANGTQYALSTRMAVAGLTPAIAFICLIYVLSLIGPESQQPKNTTESANISALCQNTSMPKVPATGDLYFIMANDITAERGGSGLGRFWGAGGGFPTQLAIECRVTNDGETAFNLALPLIFKFTKTIPVVNQPNSFTMGDASDQTYSVSIDRIAKGDSFTFYIMNISSRLLTVGLPEKVQFLRNGEQKIENLIRPPDMFAQLTPHEPK